MIEVEIDIDAYPGNWNPVLWESWIISKLKSAGIPIKGTLLYRGIEKGTLTRLDDPANFGKCKYKWSCKECLK